MLNSTGIFNQPLDYTDIKLVDLLCACILVNGKANVHPIFLQEMLGVNCNELKYRLQRIDCYILAMLNKSDAGIDNNKKMN